MFCSASGLDYDCRAHRNDHVEGLFNAAVHTEGKTPSQSAPGSAMHGRAQSRLFGNAFVESQDLVKKLAAQRRSFAARIKLLVFQCLLLLQDVREEEASQALPDIRNCHIRRTARIAVHFAGIQTLVEQFPLIVRERQPTLVSRNAVP